MARFKQAKDIKVGVIGYGGAFNMGRAHLGEMQKAGMTPAEVQNGCDNTASTSSTAIAMPTMSRSRQPPAIARPSAKSAALSNTVPFDTGKPW